MLWAKTSSRLAFLRAWVIGAAALLALEQAWAQVSCSTGFSPQGSKVCNVGSETCVPAQTCINEIYQCPDAGPGCVTLYWSGAAKVGTCGSSVDQTCNYCSGELRCATGTAFQDAGCISFGCSIYAAVSPDCI